MSHMNTSKQPYREDLEVTEAIRKVIYWFFAYPSKEISLTDLATNTGISKTTANSIVSLLVKDKFLKKDIIGKVWRLQCNIDHPLNTTLKIAYNLELIYKSGITDEVYKSVPNARNVILFGSYRKGDDTNESDIDIAVETLTTEELKVTSLITLKNIGYRKNVVVNLHQFSRKHIDINLFNNIANGIVLDGFLEVNP